MKKHHGFTLLELMIAVAISAIVLLIGVPSFSSFVRDSRVVGRTNELVTTITYARSEAVKRGTFVSLCPSSDQASCTGNSDWSVGWIVWVDDVGPANGTVDAGEEILRVGSPSNALTITSGGTSINYEASGSLEGAGDTIALQPTGCEDDERREIDLNASGRPRTSQVNCV